MRIPSRLMPKAVRTGVKPLGWVFLAALVAWYGYAVWSAPLKTLGISALVVAFFTVLSIFETKRLKAKTAALAALRKDESICTFAREFERDSLDTWIVRAIYEEVQACLPHAPNFPVRASDRFEEDLDLDSDAMDEIAVDVAQRAGRSLESANKNPLCGKVKTVGDAVRFLCDQPKVQPNHSLDRPAAQ